MTRIYRTKVPKAAPIVEVQKQSCVVSQYVAAAGPAQPGYGLQEHGLTGGGGTKHHDVFTRGHRQVVDGEREVARLYAKPLEPDHLSPLRSIRARLRLGSSTARRSTRISNPRMSSSAVTGTAASSPKPPKRS